MTQVPKVPQRLPKHHAAIEPNDHASPALSLMTAEAGSIAVLCLGVAVALRARRYVRSAATERAEGAAGAELRAGPRVLSGVVEYEDGAGEAVRVEVDQDGSERESSGSWSHTWTETRRRVKVRPFFLRLDDGRRVRVLPSQNVAFVDALDRKILVNRTKRTLVAELVPEERIFLRGELELPQRGGGAYRGDGQATLRPPRGEKMLISSEPLGERLDRRAAFHRRWAYVFFAVLAVAEILLSGFHRRWIGGRAETLEVVALEHKVEKDSEGDDVHTYLVTLASLRGAAWYRPQLVEEIDGDDYARLQERDTVAVWRGPARMGFDADQIGSHPSLHAAAVVSLFWVPLGLWLAYAATRSQSRPWYRRTVTSGHSGRLPDVGAPGSSVPHGGEG